MSREEIREYLNAVYDLERLLGKVSYKTANPRDLIAFRNSMQMLPPIKSVLEDFHSEELVKSKRYRRIAGFVHADRRGNCRRASDFHP